MKLVPLSLSLSRSLSSTVNACLSPSADNSMSCVIGTISHRSECIVHAHNVLEPLQFPHQRKSARSSSVAYGFTVCVCVAANVPTVLIAQMQHYIDHKDAKDRPSKDAPIESARGRRRLC